jgi:beta-barrel assembly-enhancing protease
MENNTMKRALLFAALAILIVATGIAEVVYTKRANNYLREGPGAFYPLIAMVPENASATVLERSGSWIKVKLSDKKSGWLAANCTIDAKPAGASGTAIANVWSSPKASKAGISAAIRGFAQKYGKTKPGNVEKVLKISMKTFSGNDLSAFVRPLETPAPTLAGRITVGDLGLGPIVYDAGISEQEVGLGVGARLIEAGSVTEKRLVDYVNLICAGIAATSESYDWDFTVFILQDSTINGYALPGGNIFLTRGALEQCSDEAELAAIIAHEMAHVIRKHGMQEMSKRIANIRSDAAFAELDEELGEKSKDELELEDMMQDMFESIVAPRLFSYELEADRVATLLLARRGYDPFGLVRIAQKVARVPREKPGIFDSRYMAADDLAERAKAIETFVHEKFDGATGGVRMRDRFLDRTAALRQAR